MSGKYRKKPVVIEAFQFDGDGVPYEPKWAHEAYKSGILYFDSVDDEAPPCDLFIKTLEGDHHVSPDDYVIRGVNGELYPCKPDIFQKTYEKVNERKKK